MLEVSRIIYWKDCNWDIESICGLRIDLLKENKQVKRKAHLLFQPVNQLLESVYLGHPLAVFLSPTFGKYK